MVGRSAQKYFNPKATEAQILKVSHAMVHNTSRTSSASQELIIHTHAGRRVLDSNGPPRAHLLLHRYLHGLALRG